MLGGDGEYNLTDSVHAHVSTEGQREGSPEQWEVRSLPRSHHGRTEGAALCPPVSPVVTVWHEQLSTES